MVEERQRDQTDQDKLFKEKIEKGLKEEQQRKTPGHAEKRELKKYNGKPLIVHLVPYSRTDLGRLKTIDEYYSGSNQNSQHAFVESILDSVVDELSGDPERRFTFAEVKYLHMWYTRQNV